MHYYEAEPHSHMTDIRMAAFQAITDRETAPGLWKAAPFPRTFYRGKSFLCRGGMTLRTMIVRPWSA